MLTPLPRPTPSDAAVGPEDLAALLGARFGTPHTTDAPPSLRATAEILDLVANNRRDLLATLWEALLSSESTREHADHLTELVAACGLVEAPSPCTTALAIAADLQRLAAAPGSWTHPAQVVRNPDTQALYELCAARREAEVGASRRRLEEILPRLERTARLTRKAASRRHESANRPNLLERWLP